MKGSTFLKLLGKINLTYVVVSIVLGLSIISYGLLDFISKGKQLEIEKTRLEIQVKADGQRMADEKKTEEEANNFQVEIQQSQAEYLKQKKTNYDNCVQNAINTYNSKLSKQAKDDFENWYKLCPPSGEREFYSLSAGQIVKRPCGPGTTPWPMTHNNSGWETQLGEEKDRCVTLYK